mmetsp:Transcript_12496/g.18869  ORF Transcript_12496/g.18869 Transcript_12496/m.18869 type:complete len:201 (+) Transcript_12496:35-637(+)
MDSRYFRDRYLFLLHDVRKTFRKIIGHEAKGFLNNQTRLKWVMTANEYSGNLIVAISKSELLSIQLKYHMLQIVATVRAEHGIIIDFRCRCSKTAIITSQFIIVVWLLEETIAQALQVVFVRFEFRFQTINSKYATMKYAVLFNRRQLIFIFFKLEFGQVMFFFIVVVLIEIIIAAIAEFLDPFINHNLHRRVVSDIINH